MDKQKIAKELVEAAKELVSADTFECPDCGGKVLEQTKYCVKCKKKVKEAADKTAGIYSVLDGRVDDKKTLKAAIADMAEFASDLAYDLGSQDDPDAPAVMAIANMLEKVAQRVKTAKSKEAAALWEKVVSEHGRRKAHKFHSLLLRQAEDYTEDKRLNPDGSLWAADFMPVMMQAASDELKKMIRTNYS